MSFDISLVSLQRDLRKSLSTEELRKNFDSIISQTFALQPPSELLKGLTPRKKLGILKTALENFEDTYHIGLWNPWVKSLFKFADQTLQDAAKNGPQPDIPITKRGSSVKPAHHISNSSKTDITAKAKPKAKPKLPPVIKQKKIYDSLYQRANNQDVPLLVGSHITCNQVDCKYCKSLFLNIPLTRCSHKSCGPGSWYPHVGERLWKSIVRYHNKPGAVFTPRKIELKENQLPSCIEWKVQSQLSTEVQSDVSNSTQSECSIGTLTSRSSKRSSNSHYTPVSSPRKRTACSDSSLSDWSKEFE